MHPRVAVVLGFVAAAASSSLFVLPSRSPALAGSLWHHRGAPASPHGLGRATASARGPAALTLVEYPLPRRGAFPHDPAVAPDGSVWYTDQANSFIGRLDPATGRIREYTLPPEAKDPHTPIFHEGLLWFTAQRSNLIGRLDPKTGEVKLFPVATPHALPYGIAEGPGGALWVALFGTNKLAHVVPESGAIHEIDLPNLQARPRRLVVDGKGRVWFADFGASRLGMLDPARRAIREWDTPDPYGKPYGITVGPDGRIWYEESSRAKVVAFDPATEQSEEVAIPTPGAIVRNMAVDSRRGRIWLALSGTGRIGRIDVPGQQATR